jgi:hypothetical protein
VFYFILREYDELPVIKYFYKFGAIPFIPLIIIQIYAYFIRVNAYGFTGYRYSSLLFIIFSVITIAITFIKQGKYSQQAILVLTFFVIFDSLTPFNLIKMAHKSQFTRMIKILNKYQMYDSGAGTLTDYDKALIEKTITDQDRDALYSSFRYLSWTSSIPMPDWAMETEYKNGNLYKNKLNFEETFGIKRESEKEKLVKFEKDFKREGRIDIRDFAEMVPFNYSEYAYQWKDGEWNEYAVEIPSAQIETKYGTFDLTDFFLTLDNDMSGNNLLWYKADENFSICFTSISYTYNEDRKLFYSYYLSGYIFYK